MRLTYIISNINYSIAFEWINSHFRNSEIELSYIFLNDKEPELFKSLTEAGANCLYIRYSKKNDLLSALVKTYRFLRRENIEMVHCHLFDANLIGLFAAKLLRLNKRVYTRHHSSYHHDYFPSAVKYDRFINLLSTDIVAISKNVENILVKDESVDKRKVHLIYHGFDLEAFDSVSNKRKETISKKYQIPESKIIIGVIGRYINWKGHKFAIEALQNLLNKGENVHLVLANSNGPDKEEIQSLIRELPRDSVTEIEFEKDLFALYQLFDVFVHVPISPKIEAFGQTYIEALASGIPSIFTLSGIAKEFVNDKNAMVVEFENSKQISDSIELLLKNDFKKIELVKNGKEAIRNFDKLRMMNSLKELYQS